MKIKLRLLNYIKNIIYMGGLGDVHDMALEKNFSIYSASSPNPILRSGKSYFSQVDEDGITEEILRRIELNLGSYRGTFVELGVGDGTENNTLLLAANGWKGHWFGGQELSFRAESAFAGRLNFDRCWITSELLTSSIIPRILNLGDLDLLSLDLDGNDWHFCKKILEAGIRPKVWIQEYNSLFPPSVSWCMPYDSTHVWDLTSYFGASLLAFNELFESFGYRLVSCNITGANAFFVRSDFDGAFKDVPRELKDLFMPSRPWLYRSRK
ncbi:MAG: hypothetical protein F2762_01075, partial [Actinobacteria bacterium]|nr:hypothetical protein [Actinomycetota bacterium]